MAELLECLICGYKTVRCGMTNHLKTHMDSRGEINYQSPFVFDTWVKSLGQVKHWSKDRTQQPKGEK